MTFPHLTGSWRWLLRVCLVALLLVTSANSGFAQTRASIPSSERQKEIAKLLNDTHNLTRLESTAKKQEAVKKLIVLSRDQDLSADERYVVLTTVISLTKETGNSANWLEAVNALIAAYEVDAQKEKTRLLTEFLEASKSGAVLKPAVDEAIAIARVAAEENRYDDANSLLRVVEATVQRATGANSLKSLIAEVRGAITTQEKNWKAYQSASTKLGTNADDPAANFTVGRWHVLQQADWKSALPFLAKVSAAKWKTASELERAAPLDAMAQAEVGDAWWEIGQTEAGATKTALLVHAGEWYARAQPNLTSSLKKQLVTKRLDEIAPLKAAANRPVALSNLSSSPSVPQPTKPQPTLPAKPQPTPPTKPQPTPPTKPQTTQLTNPGEWIDLLDWAEGIDWAPCGIDWNRYLDGPPGKEGIKLKSIEASRFPLPAIIDGDYELEAEFTRHDAIDAIEIFFPVGSHNLQMVLGGHGGKYDGVEFINSQDFFQNESTRQPSGIKSNVRHRVRIAVHYMRDNARFAIDLDDRKDYFEWDGPYSALTNVTPTGSSWMCSMIRHVWIASWKGKATFHKARIRMLSGTIRCDVITAADREQDQKDGFVRLVGEKASSSSVGTAQFVVNQTPLGDAERRWPLITHEFKVCDDFYGAHTPSRLKCPIPPGAKSFSVVGYNESSRAAKFVVFIDGKQVFDSGVKAIAVIKVDIPAKGALLELVGDPAGGNDHDYIYWCYPRFHSVNSGKSHR